MCVVYFIIARFPRTELGVFAGRLGRVCFFRVCHLLDVRRLARQYERPSKLDRLLVSAVDLAVNAKTSAFMEVDAMCHFAVRLWGVRGALSRLDFSVSRSEGGR
jgi:hypothetical protein